MSISPGPQIKSAAEAMRRFTESITAAGGADALPFDTPIVASALTLYESLYDELSLHMPELPEERREHLAEFLVRRAARDHGEEDEDCDYVDPDGMTVEEYAAALEERAR